MGVIVAVIRKTRVHISVRAKFNLCCALAQTAAAEGGGSMGWIVLVNERYIDNERFLIYFEARRYGWYRAMYTSVSLSSSAIRITAKRLHRSFCDINIIWGCLYRSFLCHKCFDPSGKVQSLPMPPNKRGAPSKVQKLAGQVAVKVQCFDRCGQIAGPGAHGQHEVRGAMGSHHALG